MVLVHEKKAFYPTRDQDERDKDVGKVFTIRLNDDELMMLKSDMKLLQQPKASTVIKQLWSVGRNVLHDKKTGEIIKIIFGNKRRNDRIGINEVE